MTRAKNYFAWQSRLVARELGQRILEIGCGVGNFTRMLLDRELVIALDIEPECISQLEARYTGAANLRALVCDTNDPAFLKLGDDRLDSCVCLNVLEHIEDDVSALQRIQSNLISGGVVVLMIPAFPSLYGPIDRNLGHFRRYSRGDVARLASAAGLRVRKLHYMNTIGLFGWWINAHILKREEQSSSQIGFFDRFLVPVMSRVEAAVPPPFGQSLFVVLEKP